MVDHFQGTLHTVRVANGGPLSGYTAHSKSGRWWTIFRIDCTQAHTYLMMISATHILFRDRSTSSVIVMGLDMYLSRPISTQHTACNNKHVQTHQCTNTCPDSSVHSTPPVTTCVNCRSFSSLPHTQPSAHTNTHTHIDKPSSYLLPAQRGRAGC